MTIEISQAFIFAAGRGERMRPLTDKLPKPLVKIRNKPILDYVIEKLDAISSINKIIINGFYLAEQIEVYIQNLNNKKIIFSHEIEKIETGGGLLFARNKIDFNKPLLLINGDTLWQENNLASDIKKLCEAYDANACDIMLGLKKTADFLGYEGNKNGGGDFNLDKKNGVLQKISNHAMSHVFVGLQIINPKILNRINKKCFSMSLFYKEALRSDDNLEGVKGIELEGKYFHVGTMAAIAETEKFF